MNEECGSFVYIMSRIHPTGRMRSVFGLSLCGLRPRSNVLKHQKGDRMKNITAIIGVVAVLIAAVGLVSTCDESTVAPAKGLEVHEWGVMIGCPTDSSYFLTSRPEIASLVREPVIYVHSRDKKPFTAQVTFNSGRPTDTYPEAAVDGQTVRWKDVNFATDIDTTTVTGPREYVPLDSILDILNDVDADCLEHGGQTARFLFYEGEVPFENKIDVVLEYTQIPHARIHNRGPYPVYDVSVVAGMYAGGTDRLNPGEIVTVALSDQVEVDLAVHLVSDGFTEKEAQAFAALWQEPFTYDSSPVATRNLMYRLPQREYDRLITLSIDPAPEKIIRSLYILVHLQK